MSVKKAIGLSIHSLKDEYIYLDSTAKKLEREGLMGVCDCCGNNYDKSFDVVMDGETYTFDSFECAVHTLAPECAHCGMKIIGHGVEANEKMYCCANCSKNEGIRGLRDRKTANVRQ